MPVRLFIVCFAACSIFISACDKDKTIFDEPFPCEDGLADGNYPCENIGMYAHISRSEFDTERLNDIWGWTDPQTGKEYALVGKYDGVAFVDVSDPENPQIIGALPESSFSAKRVDLRTADLEICEFGIGSTPEAKALTEGSVWRDLKVYQNHLFVVADAQSHGMQVFDLTNLRNFDGTVLNFDADAIYTEFSNAHNIVINETTGFAYAVGATNSVNEDFVNDCNEGGLHMMDISNPKSPVFAGCYRNTEAPRRRSNSAYIHDAQCVTYSGPDADYQGSEICFNAAERAVDIADVSDKSNPLHLGYAANPNVQYSHQGWLTEDQAYFIMNDELDELNLGRNTKTHVFDVRDLENPVFVGSFDHITRTIDHNLYIKNDHTILTNYTSGVRILENQDLSNAEFLQVGFFDTTPRNNSITFEGTWSSYPYFESGILIVSDIFGGLFVLNPHLD
ncbi:MAG: choice-of-anchor B family protein [Balneolaceae bacterium]|nr:choice-of-anchor B family protein [Balneolaceae bacterium]